MSDEDNDEIFESFLGKSKPASSNLRTPKKMVYRNAPFSPITPIQAALQEKTKRSRGKANYSLDQLLGDKVVEEDIEHRKENIKELQAIFENGEKEVEEEIEDSQSQSQSQDFDFSPSLYFSPLKSKLGEKNTNKLRELNAYNKHDFPDYLPGVKIFNKPIKLINHKKNLVTIAKFVLNDSLISEDDVTEKDWLDIISAALPHKEGYPCEITKYLWSLLLSKDYQISYAAYTKLELLISSEIILPNHLVLPAVNDLLFVINNMGGDIKKIVPDKLYQSNSNLKRGEKTEDEFFISRNIRSDIGDNLHCIKHTIMLLSLALSRFPHLYTEEDKFHILTVTMLLTCERLLLDISIDMINLIGLIISVFNNDTMIEQISKVADAILSMSLHHHNLLHIVNCIPTTQLGNSARQIFAYLFSANIVTHDQTIDDISKLKMQHILPFLSKITINDDTDYWQLFSFFSLIDKFIVQEKFTSKQRDHLDCVRNRLRKISSSIREGKGMFYDRTKVKDLLLNMISRITHLSQNMMKQTHLDSYFGGIEKMEMENT